MSSKIKVGQEEVKVNTYRIINECVERGLERGYVRAHKHTETPGKEHILDQQEQAIMSELDEYLSFGDPET